MVKMRGTLVGRVVENRLRDVDWLSVENEFVKRAKQFYDLDSELDAINSFAYEEPAVASIMESVLAQHLLGTAGCKLIDLMALPSLENGLFTVDRAVIRREYLCVILCQTRAAADSAAALLAGAFDRLELRGQARPTGSTVYLSMDDYDQFRFARDLIDELGCEGLRLRIGSNRVQIGFKENCKEPLPAIRIPEPECREAFVQKADDTFTRDVNDGMRVMVADIIEDVGERTTLGLYGSAQSMMHITESRREEIKTQLEIGPCDMLLSPTDTIRVVTIMDALIGEVGLVAKPSWAELLECGEFESEVLANYAK